MSGTVTETVVPSARGPGRPSRRLAAAARGRRPRPSSSPLTLWESLDSIAAFAGNDIATAIVEPEARAVLADFDDFAGHYEVAFTTA